MLLHQRDVRLELADEGGAVATLALRDRAELDEVAVQLRRELLRIGSLRCDDRRAGRATTSNDEDQGAPHAVSAVTLPGGSSTCEGITATPSAPASLRPVTMTSAKPSRVTSATWRSFASTSCWPDSAVNRASPIRRPYATCTFVACWSALMIVHTRSAAVPSSSVPTATAAGTPRPPCARAARAAGGRSHPAAAPIRSTRH